MSDTQATGPLLADHGEIAEAYLERLYADEPEMLERFGMEPEMMRSNAMHHIAALEEAILAKDPEIYVRWVKWLHSMLVEHGIPEVAFKKNMQQFRDTLLDILPEEKQEIIYELHVSALEAMRELELPTHSWIDVEQPQGLLAQHYLEALLAAQQHSAVRLILDAVQQGVYVREIYLHVFEPVLREVGRLWQLNKLSVADEHYSTAITMKLMGMLSARFEQSEPLDRTVLSLCVGDELHEVGARMVADFFQLEGWDSIYLGANTPSAPVLDSIDIYGTDLLALSATMTRHQQRVRELISLVRERYGDRVLIMVGGNAFNSNPDLWEQIGADGWAVSAEQAVEKANELIEKRE